MEERKRGEGEGSEGSTGVKAVGGEGTALGHCSTW